MEIIEFNVTNNLGNSCSNDRLACSNDHGGCAECYNDCKDSCSSDCCVWD